MIHIFAEETQTDNDSDAHDSIRNNNENVVMRNHSWMFDCVSTAGDAPVLTFANQSEYRGGPDSWNDGRICCKETHGIWLQPEED